MTNTSTIDRLSAHTDDYNAVARFLEWLSENGMFICERDPTTSPFVNRSPYYLIDPKALRELPLTYLGVDPDALERERSAVLEALRARNAEAPS